MQELKSLNQPGLNYKVISCSHLDEMEQEYFSILQKCNPDKKLFDRYISPLSFKIPDSIPDARSIIVIALTSYHSEVCFKYTGLDYILFIPPTYIGYDDTVEKFLKYVSLDLEPDGYKAVKTELPQKLLAVHSGLAYYGKNNITYIKGLGSYFQLFSFYTNLPVKEDTWFQLRMLDRCTKCNACISVCPTGAINNSSFIINARRCITLFNENENEFPEWIKPQAHNSLIGCMLCQHYCPENKNVRHKVDQKIDFTEEETLQILNAKVPEELNIDLRRKVYKLDLIGTHTRFPDFRRNLSILLSSGDNKKARFTTQVFP